MKRILTALLIFTMVFCLISCGGNNAEQAKQSSADGFIVIAQKSDITSLDPHLHNDVSSASVTRNVFETLVKLNNKTMQFENWLAKDLVYKDPKTLEISLREGITFSNGEPLTAEDVKFSLDRQKKSGKVGHLIAMVGDIEVVDKLKVVLHLKTPSSALTSSLSHMGSSIMCKKVVEPLDAAGKQMESSETVIGTGPFTFKSWTLGSQFELVRNENYWNEKAKSPGLIFKVIPEETSRMVALEAGEIDVLIDVPSISVNDIKANANLKMEEYITTVLNGIAFNVTKEPFNNKALRQAVAHCIDRDAIIKIQSNGYAVPNYSCIGVAAIGYTPDIKKYEYDLEKAKAKLKEGGKPDGFKFTCTLRSESQARALQVVQAACREVGIELVLDQVERAMYVERIGKGLHQSSFAGWVANAEPDNTYRPLFSKATVAAGGYNYACFWDQRIEELLEKGSTTNDNNEKLQAYTDIAKVVAEECAIIGFSSDMGFIAMRKNIEGFDVSSIYMHNFDKLHTVK